MTATSLAHPQTSSAYTIIPLSIEEYDHVEIDRHVLLKIALCFAVLLMIVLTVVGNALVCLAVLLVRKLRQPANLLLVSLAMADFCVGLLVMPIALADLATPRWPLGSFVCRLWTTADLTLCTASIGNLCAISVDRYLAISRPLRYTAMRTYFRVGVYIAIVWATALIVSISSVLITSYLDDVKLSTDSCQVTQNLGYQIYATLLSFYAPTCIMVFLYVQIWRAAKRLVKQDRILWYQGRDRNSNDSSQLLSSNKKCSQPRGYFHRPSTLFSTMKYHTRHHEKTESKARQTLGVMMSVFIICWLPFFLLAVLKPTLGLDVPPWLDSLVLWLGYSNSMLNPAIYCKYNKEFRVPFREMLFCRFSTLQNVMRQQSFTSRFGPPTKRTESIQPNADTSDV